MKRIANFVRQRWLASLIVLLVVGVAGYFVGSARVMTLWALDANSGAVRWSAEISGAMRGIDAPVLASGRAVVVPQGPEKMAHAFDPATGRQLWSVAQTWEPARDINRVQLGIDTAYLVEGDGLSETVTALDLATGAQRWKQDVETVSGAIADDDGIWLLQTTVGAPRLTHLAKLDGAELARYALDHSPGTFCTLYQCLESNGQVMLVADAYRPGQLAWPRDNRAPTLLNGAVLGGVLSDDTAYVIQESGVIAALDFQAGVRWRATPLVGERDADLRKLLLAGDLLLVVMRSRAIDTNGDVLVALDRDTGAEKWRQSVRGSFPGEPTPVATANTVLVYSDDSVRAFDRADGHPVWTLETDSSVPALSLDPATGLAYVLERGPRWRRWLMPFGVGRDLP